jgi:hypothetical protein
MTVPLSFVDRAQAALARGEFTPLLDTLSAIPPADSLRAIPLAISDYLDTLVSSGRSRRVDVFTSLVRALLHRYEIIDITSDTPWRVGEQRCAWQSEEPDVLQGWRRLRLPGIDDTANVDDTSAPVLHLTPEGGAIYEPAPLGDDSYASTLIPVQSMEQLIDLLERIA